MARCPGCGGQLRGLRKYLCLTCWYALAPLTRARLSEAHDQQKARERLFQLLSAIRRGVPLGDIQVAA
jgi:hypothetical protein